MLKNLFFLLIILFFDTFFSQNNLDSVPKYIHISKKVYNPKDKIKYLEKANSFAIKANDDSLIIKTFSEIAFQSIYQIRKYASPFSLFYQNKGFYNNNNFCLGSAYYYYYQKAKVQYKKAKNKAKFNEIYFNLLDLNDVFNDYLAIKDLAIKVFENEKFKKEYRFFAFTSTYLGVVASGLHNHVSSLEYHKLSLEISKNIKNDTTRKREEAALTNNLGLMHLDFNRFEEALIYFKQALKKMPTLRSNNLKLYATIIANIGICEIAAGKRKEGLSNLNESLKIGEEIKDLNIQILCLLEFSRLYKNEKELTKANYYIDKTLFLSEKKGFKKMETLLLAAEIYKGNKSIAFYKKYVEVKKIEEQKIQKAKSKFVRVKYETEKKEEENTYLKQQNRLNNSILKTERQKNKIATLFAVICFFAAFLIYLFYLSKKRMFAYKTNLEKAKAREEERIEIATTLHDKVAGDLWLIYQRALKIKEESITEPLSKVNLEIRNLSHELSSVCFNEVSFKDQLINLISDYFSPTLNIKVNGLDEIDWNLIESEIKRALYLAIRESIQNSKKHGLASKVIIAFERKENSIALAFTDNGKGFELSTVRYGLGLINQKKRVMELNGTYKLKSELNKGIKTNITIPLRA
jgi:signal transduction histidine kinase